MGLKLRLLVFPQGKFSSVTTMFTGSCLMIDAAA
jgi:hypothetical protein